MKPPNQIFCPLQNPLQDLLMPLPSWVGHTKGSFFFFEKDGSIRKMTPHNIMYHFIPLHSPIQQTTTIVWKVQWHHTTMDCKGINGPKGKISYLATESLTWSSMMTTLWCLDQQSQSLLTELRLSLFTPENPLGSFCKLRK